MMLRDGDCGQVRKLGYPAKSSANRSTSRYSTNSHSKEVIYCSRQAKQEWWLAMRFSVLAFFLFALVAAESAVLAESHTVGPEDDWFSWLSGNRLQSGDELVLRGGVYSDQRRLVIRCSGKPNRPIVIRGVKGESVVFRRPDDQQNTFNLDGTQHLTLRGFEITGGDTAIRIGPLGQRQSSDIVLENLHIHHIGGVAVTCNHDGAVYKRMLFRRNHVHHTGGHGEAFYLGGNNASAIFSNSIVEENYIHDLRGPSVSQGDGIEIKQGSFGNHIRNNIIHGTAYPGITVYGTNGKEQNVVEKNLIWDTGDHGIQVAADAIVRFNLIISPSGCGIFSREHQGAIPGNLRIERNAIFADQASAIRVIPPDGSSHRGYSGPVQITRNQLAVANGHPAIRVTHDKQLQLTGNYGFGDVDGIQANLQQWRHQTLTMPSLKRWNQHLAWTHLERSNVKQIVRRLATKKP